MHHLHPDLTHTTSRHHSPGYRRVRHSLEARRSRHTPGLRRVRYNLEARRSFHSRRLRRRLSLPRQVKFIAKVSDTPRLSSDLRGIFLRQVLVMIILPLTLPFPRPLTNLTADRTSQQW